MRQAKKIALRSAAVATVATALLAMVGAATTVAGAMQEVPLRGSWTALTYTLASGQEHPLEGRIFFTATEWQVLFFVLDAEGAPRRGSGEGGAYTTDGDKLVFHHSFNLSAGEALEGLPASPLRMTVNRAPSPEPTRFSISGDRLTVFFPSGNEIRFRRAS
jgi:hypothetical protein